MQTRSHFYIALILICLIFQFVTQSAYAQMQNKKNIKKAAQSNNKKSNTKKEKAPLKWANKPQLKDGEFTVFWSDRYHIFNVKEVALLDIASICLEKQNCKKFNFKVAATPDFKLGKQGFTNFGSMSCHSFDGQNLLAYDAKENMYDLCKLKDGTLIMSWSLYRKYYSR